MAFRLSMGLRNGMLGTAGMNFYELLNNGWMDIFSGSQPIDADQAETGVKLCRISSTCGTNVGDGLQLGTSGNGILPIGSPAWQGVVEVAGVAGWFRYYGSAGTGGSAGSSNTAIRFDGSVAVSGGDLNLSHTDLALDSTVTIKNGNFTQPKE
jgi:sorbitol-specific phosphotransferase system component IIA